MENSVNLGEGIERLNNGKTNRGTQKRSLEMVGKESRDVKRILVSLRKPSYTLKIGSQNVRTENRARLRRLLSRLVRQHNWDEASGVLSVLLKGTPNEKSPPNNRTKYWVAMELLRHIRGEPINLSKIQHVYEIWMKRIGSMKNWPIKDRIVVQLEFILFCLKQGSVENAHQAVLCLMQQPEFGNDPVSNMVVGLTFCQLWYSSIPEELQLRDSEEAYHPVQTEMSETRFDVSLENYEGHDATDTREAGSSFKPDSDTSVRNDKDVALNDDVHHQSQGFYMDPAEDSGHGNYSFSNHGDDMQYESNFDARGLESWLLPLRLSQSNKKLEDFIHTRGEMLNDYYKGAVKHLRIALNAKSPVYEAFLPFVQMLLLGNHIDEALDEAEKLSYNSEMILPLRVKASLLEHFDGANYVKLSTCFEDILKKDPTCSHSLLKLVNMHHNGDYSPQHLLEMIALHLDATYPECNIWKEFASCLLKIYSWEEDRLSMCLDGKEGTNKQRCSVRFNRIPEIFTQGISGKTWRFRCRWWLTRHFSLNIIKSEIEAGDLQLLTYKAASASHMYGPQFEYVAKAYIVLENQDRDLFLSLKLHMLNCVGFYSNFDGK